MIGLGFDNKYHLLPIVGLRHVMIQMGGVQEENHLVALSPPGGLHVHCPGELVPLITTISIST